MREYRKLVTHSTGGLKMKDGTSLAQELEQFKSGLLPEITTMEQAVEAGAMLKSCQAYENKFKEVTKPMADSIKKSQDEFKKLFAPIKQNIEETKKQIKSVLETYINDRAYEVAMENSQRVQEITDKKSDMYHEALILDQKGCALEADKLRQSADLMCPSVNVESLTIPCIAQTPIFDIEIIQPDEVPDQYKQVVINEKTIKDFVKNTKGEIQIPGVLIKKRITVKSR